MGAQIAWGVRFESWDKLQAGLRETRGSTLAADRLPDAMSKISPKARSRMGSKVGHMGVGQTTPPGDRRF